MALYLAIDHAALQRACRERGVSRMRVFGSATREAFDDERSDVDLLVEFEPSITDLFDAYFGLKEDLEQIFGRPVDLVMTDAVSNPHFAAETNRAAEVLYAH
jgi:predicted nucleotidyltransferase